MSKALFSLLNRLRFHRKFLLGIFIFILSGVLVFSNLGIPNAIVFDETYHIPSAQKYLNHVFFQENHPPLGKLLIAAGFLFYENGQTTSDFIDVEKIDQAWPSYLNILGYRLAPALFGLFVPLFVFILVDLLTGKVMLALITSLLLLFDTAFLMQARTAMLDVFLLFFICSGLIFFCIAVKKDQIDSRSIILYGFLAGCAVSVKLTGLIMIAPLGWLVLAKICSRRWLQVVKLLAVFGLPFAITYLGWWDVHFQISTEIIPGHTYNASQEQISALSFADSNPSFLSKFGIRLYDAHKYQIEYNRGVPSLKVGDPDEIGSPWYQWLLGGKAINYRWETPDGESYRYSYLVPNPVTWMVSLIGMLLGTAVVISNQIFRFLPDISLVKYLYFFTLLYWGYIMPFWFFKRVMYLYHYLPGMLFGLVQFSLLFAIICSQRVNLYFPVLINLCILAIAAFMLLSPFVYYVPLSDAQFEFRNFWPFWDLKCVKCL